MRLAGDTAGHVGIDVLAITEIDLGLDMSPRRQYKVGIWGSAAHVEVKARSWTVKRLHLDFAGRVFFPA